MDVDTDSKTYQHRHTYRTSQIQSSSKNTDTMRNDVS